MTWSDFAPCAAVALALLLVSRDARADESLSAEEFAARCADANGNLTLDQNVRVDARATPS